MIGAASCCRQDLNDPPTAVGGIRSRARRRFNHTLQRTQHQPFDWAPLIDITTPVI